MEKFFFTDPETRVFQAAEAKIWWLSSHRFWLIHSCDGQTDRTAMAKTRYSSLAVRRKSVLA